jgi:hypothetical protein
MVANDALVLRERSVCGCPVDRILSAFLMKIFYEVFTGSAPLTALVTGAINKP